MNRLAPAAFVAPMLRNNQKYTGPLLVFTDAGLGLEKQDVGGLGVVVTDAQGTPLAALSIPEETPQARGFDVNLLEARAAIFGIRVASMVRAGAARCVLIAGHEMGGDELQELSTRLGAAAPLFLG